MGGGTGQNYSGTGKIIWMSQFLLQKTLLLIHFILTRQIIQHLRVTFYGP